jgi:hypothetical protein
VPQSLKLAVTQQKLSASCILQTTDAIKRPVASELLYRYGCLPHAT